MAAIAMQAFSLYAVSLHLAVCELRLLIKEKEAMSVFSANKAISVDAVTQSRFRLLTNAHNSKVSNTD